MSGRAAARVGRLAWASPLVARSAIGRESVRVTEGLARRGWEVTLIGTERERPEEPLHATGLVTRHWADVPLETLARDYDLLVVNVGDNYLFHAGVFPLMDAAPALGVFHDFCILNLLNGWLDAQGRPLAEAAGVMAETYGTSEAETRPAVDGRLSLAEVVRRFPMTEWVAARCAAGLAHAEFYAERIRAGCPGPVAVARMPVASRAVPPPARRPPGRLRVLTVGHMNANKCVDRVIEAIAGSEGLRGTTTYRLAGAIDAAERDRLTGLAARLGFAGLEVLGPVDEPRLTRELTEADVIACLRNPVLEGSSGSAIEALLSGRPVIVADQGFYAELPDELVCKVPPEVPPAAIAAQLERLAAEPALRRRTGAKARAWAERTFALEAYLDVLEDLMRRTLRVAPWLSVGAALGGELAALGLSPDDPAARRLGAALDVLAEAPRPAPFRP